MGRNLLACIEERYPLDPHKNPALSACGPWRFRRYIDFTDRHNGVYDALDARAELAVARTLDLDPATRTKIDPDVDWATLDDDTGICVVSAEMYLQALGTWLACDVKDICRSYELLSIGADLMRAIGRPVAMQERVIFWYGDTPFVSIAQTKRDRAHLRVAAEKILRVPVDEDGKPSLGGEDALASLLEPNPGNALACPGLTRVVSVLLTSQLAARFPEIPAPAVAPAPVPAPAPARRTVLFLDIDGVLVIPDPDGVTAEVADHLSKACVERLNRIVAATDARVVISSEWRYGHTCEELAAYLHTNGFVGEVIGMTPEGPAPRGSHILRWMEQNDVYFYLVLDDQLLDLRGYITLGRTIAVDPRTGLSDANVEDAIERWTRWNEMQTSLRTELRSGPAGTR